MDRYVKQLAEMLESECPDSAVRAEAALLSFYGEDPEAR
jgi:hypothetical protein